MDGGIGIGVSPLFEKTNDGTRHGYMLRSSSAYRIVTEEVRRNSSFTLSKFLDLFEQEDEGFKVYLTGDTFAARKAQQNDGSIRRHAFELRLWDLGRVGTWIRLYGGTNEDGEAALNIMLSLFEGVSVVGMEICGYGETFVPYFLSQRNMGLLLSMAMVCFTNVQFSLEHSMYLVDGIIQSTRLVLDSCCLVDRGDWFVEYYQAQDRPKLFSFKLSGRYRQGRCGLPMGLNRRNMFRLLRVIRVDRFRLERVDVGSPAAWDALGRANVRELDIDMKRVKLLSCQIQHLACGLKGRVVGLDLLGLKNTEYHPRDFDVLRDALLVKCPMHLHFEGLHSYFERPPYNLDVARRDDLQRRWRTRCIGRVVSKQRNVTCACFDSETFDGKYYGEMIGVKTWTNRRLKRCGSIQNADRNIRPVLLLAALVRAREPIEVHGLLVQNIDVVVSYLVARTTITCGATRRSSRKRRRC